MATFRHNIAGKFNLKPSRSYMIVKVFRPLVRGHINHIGETREILTDIFRGENINDYSSFIPKDWKRGISYEIHRIRKKTNSGYPKMFYFS